MKSMRTILYIILVVLNIFLFALVVHCAVEHPSPNNYAHEFKYANRIIRKEKSIMKQ